MPNFKISIPKPCNQDWNKMTPNGNGRFCGSCSKTVVDFTAMNIDDIKDYFANNIGQKTCGHFRVVSNAPKPPKHHQMLTSLYQKTERNPIRFLRTPFLFFIGIAMSVVGCKSESTGGEVVITKDTIASPVDTSKVVPLMGDTIESIEKMDTPVIILGEACEAKPNRGSKIGKVVTRVYGNSFVEVDSVNKPCFFSK